MKFLICTDPKKIKNHEIYSLGNYYYCHDEEVNLYRGMGCDILWQGYTIEQPIEELLNDWWALKRANGNFFAVRIMPHKIDYALDYFNNHKIFSAHKYGFEMSNHLPWMTKNEHDDIVRTLYSMNHLYVESSHRTNALHSLNTYILCYPHTIISLTQRRHTTLS